MTTNHFARIEAVQTLLGLDDATLAQIEDGKRDLHQVIAAGDAEREEIASRRKIEMTAATPAGELNRKLDALDKREKEVARLVEIANAVLAELEPRLAAAREDDNSARRRATYDEAHARHAAASSRVKEFLDRVGLEAHEVMRAYAESEAATAAANRNLPLDASPIASIEDERRGNVSAPKTTVRQYRRFVHQGNPIYEVGKVEAYPAPNGLWTIYRRSNAIQGDETIGPCTIADFVEIRTEQYAHRRLENLISSLRIPAFYSTQQPERVRVDTRNLPLTEWLRINGEAEKAHPVPAPVAAE
jgi:hypothetical protein